VHVGEEAMESVYQGATKVTEDLYLKRKKVVEEL
jgi:hypothetical protein